MSQAAAPHPSIGADSHHHVDEASTFFVRALYAYSSLDSSALSFEQGDLIEVMSTLPSGWWDGIHCENKLRGWFPSNYVERASEDEAAQAQEHMQAYWDGDDTDLLSTLQNELDDEFAGGVVNELSAGDTLQRQRESRISNRSSASSADLWVPKVNEAGEVYYFNSRTGETSRDLPTDSKGDDDWTATRNDTSSLSTATNTPQLSSGAFSSPTPAWSEPTASTSQIIDEAEHLSSEALSQGVQSLTLRGQPLASTSRKARRIDSVKKGHRKTLSKEKASRKATLDELLTTPPPPFLHDLEALVKVALQELAASTNSASAPSLAINERDRLAVLGDAVVNAVRTMLHATAMFDQHAFSTAISASRPDPPPNAYKALRSMSRRVTSSLSKLTLSVRAVWGLPELGPVPDELDPDDMALEREGPEAYAAARERMLEQAAYERQVHRQTELKLRSDIVSGIRDLQAAVSTFVNEFERIFAPDQVGQSTLRAPLLLRGALTIDASTLVLPGGGFGGSWRGNGFATLPTDAATFHSGDAEMPVAQYTYPSRPLSTAVASALESTSLNVASKVTSATHLVQELAGRARGLSISEDAVVNAADQVQQALGELLRQTEDIDLAGSIHHNTTKDESADPVDDSAVVEYRESVKRARSLLADFDRAKQAVYDSSAQILLDLQDVFLAPETPAVSGVIGPQPAWNSPLTTGWAAQKEVKTADALVSTLTQAGSSAKELCKVVRSLAAVAEVQARAPSHLRPMPTKAHEDERAQIPSRPESRATGGYPDSTYSHTSSYRSGLQEETRAPRSIASKESIDSDFYFSNGQQPASASSTLKSAAKGILGPVGAVWGRRRGSVETANTSQSSLADTRSPSQASLSASASASKLAKILGTESPTASSSGWRSATDPLPPWLGPDYDPSEVSFGPEGQIRGGTLRALVIAATSHEGRIDSSYLSAFLMTYRTFCTPYELLNCLAERFMVVQPEGLTPEEVKEWEVRKLKPVRARTANVIKTWVRDFMDTDIEPEVLRRIADFATNTMRDRVQSPQIVKVVEERMAGVAPRSLGNLAPGQPPAPVLPRNLRKIKLVDVDPLEIARQISIMDGKLFTKITPQECLGKAWPREYGSDSPNISAMIDMSNAVTRWVTETILQQEETKKRAAIIKHFILIAERCLTLNNFSTLIHIIAGLNSTPIHRLRRTWEAVSQKSMVSLGILNNLMRPDKNYKEYREHLRRVTPPCVPFMGVYLTDWTFIGDGNPDMLREKPNQINFNKRQKASELILMIKLHQSTTYNLTVVPTLAQYLQDNLFSAGSASGSTADDQRLYELSLAREPRERDDEKIARLLSESGFL
ncbi:hypothetical protein ACM66B_000131 [Microbotryomycetes sp. NB124-2]